MARFDLDSYETVAERLARAHKDHPDLRVITNLVEVARDERNHPIQYIVQAQIYIGDVLKAQDYAEEMVGGNGVNKTSALENCATSSIGRCLADMGYQGVDPRKTRPSREEMEKVERATVTKEVKATPELIQMATIAYEQVADIQNMAELKNFYTGAQEAGILYINVDGTNLNAEIGKQKAKIEASEKATEVVKKAAGVK